MPKYAYVAFAPDGSELRGLQEASTLGEAKRALLERQIEVTALTQRRGFRDIQVTHDGIKRADLMHLSRQLAVFLRAGIPILEAIASLAEESDKAPVVRVMTQIGEDLRAGARLSDAVDKHPKDFPAFYRGILRSAELIGNIDTVLERLATYLERDLEARRKIRGALIYPSIVALMSLVTVGVLALYVLPQFKDFFKSLDAELPLPTRMLLGITDFVGTWWWLGFILFILIAGGAALALRTAPGRLARDRLLLSLPVLGVTVRYALIERFTRLLSSMVTAGVPLPEAMRVSTESLRNVIFESALTDARHQMVEGDGLARPIARTGLFPGVATQMFRVGEETGTLDQQLETAAEYYERELDYKIKKLTTIFEPLVITVMGIVVGFVAIALVSAMYGIFRAAHNSGAI